MNDEKTIVEKCPLACVQGYAGPHQDDEIDLRELLISLWQKKMMIIAITVLCGLGATVFALTQPKLYNVSSQIRLAVNKVDVGSKALNTLKKLDFTGASLALGKGDPWVVVVSAQGEDSKQIYDAVNVDLPELDLKFKKTLVREYQTEVDIIQKILLDRNVTGQTRFVLEEKLAEKLYSLARYKSVAIPSLTIVQMPSLPTTPVKPKVAFIVALGIMSGGMLGAAWVLIGHIFSKRD